MTINCIVVDDEPIARDILIHYIGQIPYLNLVGSCADAFEAMELIRTKDIDLIILDINMPRLTGFEMLRSLKKYPAVIITSAYSEYALEGFELSVLDYLLKPFSFPRFVQATEKLLKTSQEPARAAMPTSPAVSATPSTTATSSTPAASSPGTPPAATPTTPPTPANRAPEDDPEAWLMVKSDKKLAKIFLNEIIFVEAYGNYIFIHRAADKIISKQTMSQFETQLPASKFIRTHKSFIVSLNAVKYIEGNQVAIGDQKIPIGKVYRENLLKRFQ